MGAVPAVTAGLLVAAPWASRIKVGVATPVRVAAAESIWRPSSTSAVGKQQTGWPMRSESRRLRLRGRREREEDGRTSLDKTGTEATTTSYQPPVAGDLSVEGSMKTN